MTVMFEEGIDADAFELGEEPFARVVLSPPAEPFALPQPQPHELVEQLLVSFELAFRFAGGAGGGEIGVVLFMLLFGVGLVAGISGAGVSAGFFGGSVGLFGLVQPIASTKTSAMDNIPTAQSREVSFLFINTVSRFF